MRIGIDISQIAYEQTGVANYLRQLIQHLTQIDKQNEYILFYSSLRRSLPELGLDLTKNISIKQFKMPPTVLDILWNKLHIAPIEWFIGDIDLFISSDWTQAPTQRAKKATILYDLIVYTYPEETANKIVETQKRRLSWVKKECDVILCISESTKKDAKQILNIEDKRLKVIYAGV